MNFNTIQPYLNYFATFEVVPLLILFIGACVTFYFDMKENAKDPAKRRKLVSTFAILGVVAFLASLVDFGIKQAGAKRAEEKSAESSQMLTQDLLKKDAQLHDITSQLTGLSAKNDSLQGSLLARDRLRAMSESERLGQITNWLSQIKERFNDCPGCASNSLRLLAGFAQGLTNASVPDIKHRADDVLRRIDQMQSDLNGAPAQGGLSEKSQSIQLPKQNGIVQPPPPTNFHVGTPEASPPPPANLHIISN